MEKKSSITLQSTSTLIEVVVLQIKNALLESEEGMEKLSTQFVEAGISLDTLANSDDIRAIRESNPDVDVALNYCMENLNAAIVNGQFYDRLHQRLEHAVISLNTLIANLSQQDLESRSTEEILEEIISCYSLEEEHEIIRRLFRSVIGDNSDYRYKNPKYKNEESSVELF